MELGSEFEKEPFILVSPEDRIDADPADDYYKFDGAERRIPDLGTVFLAVYGGISYFDDDLGVAIIEDNVVIKKANELQDMGLFIIGLRLGDLPIGETSVSCKMVYPQCDLSLEGQAEIEEDLGGVGVSGDVREWKMRGDDRKLFFFAPADPKFLSQLRFSFGQIHNLPQNQ